MRTTALLALLVAATPKPAVAQTTPPETSIAQAPPAPATTNKDIVAPPPAVAQPKPEPPSRGIGLIIAGSVMTGLGVLNLASTAVCKTDFYVDLVDQDGADLCFVVSLAVGGGLSLIGIPLLITGLVQRSNYRAWKEQHALDINVDVANRRLALAFRF